MLVFVIKVFKEGDTDYTAHQCRSFKRCFAGYKEETGKRMALYTLEMDRATNDAIDGPSTYVLPIENATAYIENAAGKTVDVIRSNWVPTP